LNSICIKPVNKDNWEEATLISVFEEQKEFVPSVMESLAGAYIKPWDEALDPYVLYKDDKLIGFFYISYTPDSSDNYWIGGFQIDKQHQRKGLGEQSLRRILEFIREEHLHCEIVSLTVERKNNVARGLYEKLGFTTQGELNQSGEIIYKLRLNKG